MRKKFYWDAQAGEWTERRPRREQSKLQIIPDIEPYKNVIDGKVVGGRRQHRDFLRAHGCIEVGNERVERKPAPAPDVTPAFLKAWSQLGYD